MTLVVLGSLLAFAALVAYRVNRDDSDEPVASIAEISRTRSLTPPQNGEAYAASTLDGTPLIVVSHPHGSVTGVAAISPHAPWGIKKLIGWCPSSRTFDDPFHGSKFDEHGRYLIGPSPTGLVRARVQAIAGNPYKIRVGAPYALPIPKQTHPERSEGRSCLGATPEQAGLVIPGAAGDLTAAGLVRLAPLGRWSVMAVLHAVRGAPLRLCAEVLAEGTCRAGAPAELIAPEAFTPPGGAIDIPGEWLVLIRDGALVDPIRAA